jgi:hypothetical protein
MITISTKASLAIKHCRNELDKLLKESKYSESKLVSILETLDLVIQEFPKNVDVCVLCKDTTSYGNN